MVSVLYIRVQKGVNKYMLDGCGVVELGGDACRGCIRKLVSKMLIDKDILVS